MTVPTNFMPQRFKSLDIPPRCWYSPESHHNISARLVEHPVDAADGAAGQFPYSPQ